MAQLTNRQVNILKSVIEEFIDTAEPVGSATVEKKYNLDVSPATIRTEMSKLTQLGYLKKPHPSAGRMPTSMGLKYYVKNLMNPEKLSVAQEVGVKEKIWDYRNDFERFLEEATKELSRRTQSLALSTTQDGSFYAYGVANLLDYKEFFDIDVTKTVLSLIDKTDYWVKIVEQTFSNGMEQPFYLLIGEELEREFLEPCGFVYQTYDCGQIKGVIGVMGPARLPYSKVVPLVDYVAQLLSEYGR
jgi:transcriptional regulator of heat shock response